MSLHYTGIKYSCTPERDFRCFYPCEIILSHPYQPMGKIKNEQPHAGCTSIRDVIEMSSHIYESRTFWKPFLGSFNIINAVLSGEQEK